MSQGRLGLAVSSTRNTTKMIISPMNRSLRPK
jgi:hypothetical protein